MKRTTWPWYEQYTFPQFVTDSIELQLFHLKTPHCNLVLKVRLVFHTQNNVPERYNNKKWRNRNLPTVNTNLFSFLITVISVCSRRQTKEKQEIIPHASCGAFSRSPCQGRRVLSWIVTQKPLEVRRWDGEAIRCCLCFEPKLERSKLLLQNYSEQYVCRCVFSPPVRLTLPCPLRPLIMSDRFYFPFLWLPFHDESHHLIYHAAVAKCLPVRSLDPDVFPFLTAFRSSGK